MNTFELPPSIADLIHARNNLRAYYAQRLLEQDEGVHLKFTLDGNLVGDLGEALAVELFGVRLVTAKSTEGIDGYVADGRTVQVKATGTGRGPAFRQTETRADHLLFFDLDFEKASGTIVFNGPEHYAVRCLPNQFANQRSLTPKQIRDSDKLVQLHERLKRIDI